MIIDAFKLRLALVNKCKGNKELAKQAGICEGTVTKLCKADCKVRNATAGKIARALGCDPMELLKA
jgi:DNA-binding Xre family transcriptional regulator